MNLIAIQKNLLINPELISTVESRKVGKATVINVTVSGRSHRVTEDVNAFMATIMGAGSDVTKQFTAV